MPISPDQLQAYKSNWIGKPNAQIIEELASISMETNRFPDPYNFLYNTNGKLISPETGKRVDQSISKNTTLDLLELQGFEFIEKVGWQHEEGTILWISPPHRLRSPDAKAVVSCIRKQSGVKYLENRALLLGMSLKDCLDLANGLNQDYVYLTEDHLRQQPVFLEGQSFDWSIFPDTKQVEMVQNGEDIKAKQYALAKAKLHIQRPEHLLKDDFFGNFEVSCPPSAFQFFSGEKRILCCTCPFCGQRVEAEIYAGKIHCPNCQKNVDWLDQN